MRSSTCSTSTRLSGTSSVAAARPASAGSACSAGRWPGRPWWRRAGPCPPDRSVHSLHAYFIRPGDPTVPLVYVVDRVRDGRSFTTRRVTTIQHGKTIFTLSASFHLSEPGFEHSDAMPSVPGPEQIEPTADRLRRLYGPGVEEYARENPIDIRYVGPLTAEAARDRTLISSRSIVWLKADGELPDDPLLHVCLMTYASDMTLLDTVLLAHGASWGENLAIGASLDHAMWFHRPFRIDQLAAIRSGLADGQRGQGPGQRRGLHREWGTGCVRGSRGSAAPQRAKLITGRRQPGYEEAAGRKIVASVQGAYVGFCLSARRPTTPERRCPKMLNFTPATAGAANAYAAQAATRPLAGFGAGAFTCEGAWVGSRSQREDRSAGPAAHQGGYRCHRGGPVAGGCLRRRRA